MAFIFGIFQTWGEGVDGISLGLLILFYFISGLGVTIGFHRCFTHKGFKIKKDWLKWCLAVSGSMAAEGSVFTWVGWHLKHHIYSDKEGDPHSPHLYGRGFLNVLKGFWYSHVGWLFITPMPDEKLIANEIGADSVNYISNEAFIRAYNPNGRFIKPKNPQDIFLINGGCGGCITGKYPA